MALAHPSAWQRRGTAPQHEEQVGTRARAQVRSGTSVNGHLVAPVSEDLAPASLYITKQDPPPVDEVALFVAGQEALKELLHQVALNVLGN